MSKTPETRDTRPGSLSLEAAHTLGSQEGSDSRHQPNVRAVERALTLLSVFTSQEPELTLDQLSERAALAKSTTHRLLQTLLATGFIERGGRHGAYRLSLLMARLGAIAMQDRTKEAIHRTIRALRDDVGETVGLAILEQDVAIVVDRVVSLQPLHYNIHVGSRLPAHATSSGKALLAELAPDAIDKLYPLELPAFTPSTVKSRDDLKSQLAEVRRAGFAVDNEEFAQGLRCISVPVRDLAGKAVYSLGISGVSARLTVDHLVALRPKLEEAARFIEPHLLMGETSVVPQAQP